MIAKQNYSSFEICKQCPIVRWKGFIFPSIEKVSFLLALSRTDVKQWCTTHEYELLELEKSTTSEIDDGDEEEEEEEGENSHRKQKKEKYEKEMK